MYDASGVDPALAILQSSADSIQILFTGVQMPPGHLNGFHLARECSKKWLRIGIIVASGMIETRPADMPEGARFVRKPFSSEVVHNHLAEILPDGQKPQPLKHHFS